MKSLTPTQTQIIGTALMELLDGKLTDETIQQINTLKRDEICHPTEHIIGFILGSWSQVENWLTKGKPGGKWVNPPEGPLNLVPPH